MRNKEKTIKINVISKTLKILFAMALLFTMTFASRKAVKADIASGTSGTCSWVIDDNGTLTIRSTNGVEGTLESYTSGNGPFYNYRTNIKKVVVENGVKTGSGCYYLFYGLAKCEEIDLSGLDTSNATNMKSMFQNCEALTSLDLGDKFDTSSVTNMTSMFYNCPALTSLDLGDNFNTSNVINMSFMFSYCKALTSLDLGDKFDTSNVKKMEQMFNECEVLTSLDLGDKFDTSNVTNMDNMFSYCKALTSLDLGDNFNTSSVGTMFQMFYECKALTSLDLGDKFDTSNVGTMYRMFSDCQSLTSLDLGDKFDTSNATNMDSMFYSCNALTSLDLGDKFDTSNVTDMSYMFSGCNAITALDLGDKFNTSNVTDMGTMFSNCSSLTSLDLEDKFDTSNVRYMNGMFSSCSSLTSLDLGDKFDTSSVGTMYQMFYNCKSLTSLDLGNKFDTGNVTTMEKMFYECQALTSLDLGDKFDTSNVTDMMNMFYYCKSLTSLDLGDNFNTGNVTNMSNMFNNCNALTSLDLGDKFDTSNVTNMSKMFYNNQALTSLDLGDKFDTSNVTNMHAMFNSCQSLTSLDLGNKFDTNKVTNMNAMFAYCRVLASLDLGDKFDTSQVTTMSQMFQNCSSLASLNLGNLFDTSNVTDMYQMFYMCQSLASLNLGDKFDTSNVGDMSNMFYATYKISSIILDDEFSFKGSGSTSCTLEAPPFSQDGINYTRKWIRKDKSYGPYTPVELCYNYTPAMAGEWVWERAILPELRVQFDANGGMTTAQSQVITATNTQLHLPDRTTTKYPHYALVKWTENQDGSGTEFTPGNTVTINLRDYTSSPITLYAQWEPSNLREYTVKHYQQKADLSGYDLTETEKFEADKGTTVTPAVKTYPNFTSPTPISGIVKDDDSLVISYKYNRPSYTIVYNGNGATSGITTSQQMPIGIAKKLNANLYEKTNSIFTGWNTAADGSGTGYADTQSVNNLAVANNEITLYAQWMSSENQSLTPQNGQVTVKGKSGETIVIPNIPDGTNYSVTETDLPDGWTQTGIVNGEGTIVANESSEVTVTNRYAATGKARIVAHKRLQGGDLTAGAFEFELYKGSATGTPIDRKGNDAVDTVEELSDDTDGTIYANPWYGTAPVYFDELNFTQADIGQTYTYYIKETNGGDSHISYDAHTETVTITVSDAGHGMLNCNVSYDADGALFTNTQIVKTNELSITKTVDNRTDNTDEFKFTVSLKDQTDTDLTDAYEYDVIKNSNVIRSDIIRANGTITLKNGEKAVIKALPENTKYNVTEQDTTGYSLVSANGNIGTITDTATSEATFTNHYRAEGTAELAATKTIDNANIADYTFGFDLLDENLTVIQTKSNDEHGDITFDPLNFTESDVGHTYTYYIKERTGEDRDIIYDPHTEEVTITVENGPNGTLNVTKTYDNDGAAFRNEYHYHANGSVTLQANKTLENASLTEYSFNFELLNSAETIIGTATSNASGQVTFDAINYDENDINQTYTYYIREKAGTNTNIEYDNHRETVTVRVTDNGDGTLTATPTYDANGANFRNTYNYHATGSAVIEATKTLEDGNLADYTFTFELLNSNRQLIEAKPCNAQGLVSFTALNYNENDIGKTYTYYIRERANTGDSIVYDEHTEAVTVSITDNGNNTLNVVKTYDADGAKFRNRVVTSYSIQVNKIVENHNPVFGDMTFTFVLEGTTKSGEHARFEKMVTVPSDKQASFVWENIPAGTYTIKELSVSRYKVKSVTGSSNVTPNGATASIVLDSEGTQVTFTNRYDQHNKLSHNSSAVNHIG